MFENWRLACSHRMIIFYYYILLPYYCATTQLAVTGRCNDKPECSVNIFFRFMSQSSMRWSFDAWMCCCCCYCQGCAFTCIHTFGWYMHGYIIFVYILMVTNSHAFHFWKWCEMQKAKCRPTTTIAVCANFKCPNPAPELRKAFILSSQYTSHGSAQWNKPWPMCACVHICLDL